MAKRLALLVGTTRYEDELLTTLKGPEADVRCLADVLRAPEICGFDDVNLLLNATASHVRLAVCEFFSRGTPEDLLVLYFSGHGVVDPGGGLYFCMSDTRKSLLRATALPAALVRDEMDSSRSRSQLLILDCCHAGAFERDAKSAGVGMSVGTRDAFEGTGIGRVVLTASDATQFALQGDSLVGTPQPSVFTHYLIEALQTGMADTNGDGKVTIDEIYEYVYRRVLEENPRQTPGKWAYKQHGEIVLARNPQPKARPDLLDHRLIDVLRSDAPHALREAAASGLIQCLDDPRPGVALAAKEVLQDFLADDSRTISTLIQRALGVGAEYTSSERTTSPRASAPPRISSLRPSQVPNSTPGSAGTLSPDTARSGSSLLPSAQTSSLTPNTVSTLPSQQRRRVPATVAVAMGAAALVAGTYAVMYATLKLKHTTVAAPTASSKGDEAKSLASVVITSAGPEPVQVALDGNAIGALPRTIDHVTPGHHTLDFTGDAAFEPERRELAVTPGATIHLEPVRLKPRQRMLSITLEPQLERAKVFVVQAGVPHQITHFPAKIPIANADDCALEAILDKKRFTQPVKFESGRWDTEVAITTQSPWTSKSKASQTNNLSESAAPTLSVQVRPARCELTGQQVQDSFGAVKSRLASCATAKSSLGAAHYSLRFASSGSPIAAPSVQSTTLDARTDACIANTLGTLSGGPLLAGCTVDIRITVGAR